MSCIKVSNHFRDHWKVYPHLRNVWNTQYLLQSQNVDFATWCDDQYSFALRDGIYTTSDMAITHYLDVAVSRGSIKGIVKYNDEQMGVSGNDIITAKTFISLNITKFNGIINMTMHDNIVLEVNLSPNTNAIKYYCSNLSRLLKKYYDYT